MPKEEMNVAKEEAAVQAAFEQQIGLMYTVLLDAIVQDDTDAEAACQRFRKWLSLARRAKDLTCKILSEQIAP